MSERTYYSEESKQSAQTKTTMIIGLCLAIGAIIGTAVTVLFAPQSGDDTRNDLNDARDTAINKLQDQVDDLRQQFEQAIS